MMPAVDDEEQAETLHDWHVTFLLELGCSWDSVQQWGDDVDLHGVADLIRAGCPPDLALDIAR